MNSGQPAGISGQLARAQLPAAGAKLPVLWGGKELACGDTTKEGVGNAPVNPRLFFYAAVRFAQEDEDQPWRSGRVPPEESFALPQKWIPCAKIGSMYHLLWDETLHFDLKAPRPEHSTP